MKRLGGLAIERGFSQEGLAKALNDRFGLSLNGANVYAHVTAKRPQRDTIKRYAQLLGLNAEQLHVVEHGMISADGERYWGGHIVSALAAHTGEFKPGVLDAVGRLLRDPNIRARALTSVAMGGHLPDRAKRWLPRALPPELDILAEALYPHLDMRDYLRERSPGDETLFPIYHSVRSLYRDDTKALAFVDACAAILEIDGFDTDPMQEYLRDVLGTRGVRVADKSRRKEERPKS